MNLVEIEISTILGCILIFEESTSCCQQHHAQVRNYYIDLQCQRQLLAMKKTKAGIAVCQPLILAELIL
jgi:hypothetical protein